MNPRDRFRRRGAMSLAECQSALETARQEAAEFHDKYLRAATALANARKNAERDATQRTNDRIRGFGLQLLDVADNLERALAFASDDDPLRVGVQATLQQLHIVLAQQGIVPIDVTPGMPFDPHYHEAVATRTDADAAQDSVLEVTQTGYTIEDQVLRPARVVVAQAQA